MSGVIEKVVLLDRTEQKVTLPGRITPLSYSRDPESSALWVIIHDVNDVPLTRRVYTLCRGMAMPDIPVTYVGTYRLDGLTTHCFIETL